MRYSVMIVVFVGFMAGGLLCVPLFADESSGSSIKSTIEEIKNAKSEADRLRALQKLYAQKPITAVDVQALLGGLRDKAIDFKTTEILWKNDNPELKLFIPLLIQALDDPDLDVESAAALALGKMKAKEAVPVLIKKFQSLPRIDGKSPVKERREAEKYGRLGMFLATALGLIGDPSAVPALIARPEFYFLEGESPLALIGAPAVPALLAVAKDTKDPRREKVCSIINSIKDPAAVPFLKTILKDRDADSSLKTSALVALAKMGTPGIDLEAQTLLTDPDEHARLAALYWMVKYDKASYTPKLLEFLHDKSWYVRTSTADFAGDLGVSEAAPRLIQLLNDKEANVQKSSLRALEKLGKEKASLTVLDDRRVHAKITVNGEKHEAVIADISLVRQVRKGQR